MSTLEENIRQAIADFDSVKAAIEESGVEVPYDTDTSKYGDMVRQAVNNAGGGSAYQAGYSDGVEVGKQAEYDRFWDDFQQNGMRESYSYAFSGEAWSDKTFKPKYPIKIVETAANQQKGRGMFQYFRRKQREAGETPCSLTPEIVDFSECLDASFIFLNAWFGEVTVDFGNATTLGETFACANGGGGIRKINLRVTEKTTTFNNTFNYARRTEELNFTEDSVVAASLDLKRSTGLTLDSGKSVLKAIKDYSGTENEGKYTISLPVELWEQLDADGETSPSGGTWKQFVEQKGWIY